MTRARFVIVLYNGAAYLENLLGYFLDQLTPEDELILVDNASRDGSTDLVHAKWPQVRLVPGPVLADILDLARSFRTGRNGLKASLLAWGWVLQKVGAVVNVLFRANARVVMRLCRS